MTAEALYVAFVNATMVTRLFVLPPWNSGLVHGIVEVVGLEFPFIT